MEKPVPANKRLKAAREQRCWTQEKLAEEVGVAPGTVARWEGGKSVPYPYHREKLCNVLGKTSEELGLLPADAEPRSLQETSPEPAIDKE